VIFWRGVSWEWARRLNPSSLCQSRGCRFKSRRALRAVTSLAASAASVALPETQQWTRTPGKLPSGFTITTRGSSSVPHQRIIPVGGPYREPWSGRVA